MDFALCLVLACFSNATSGEDNAHVPRLGSAERIVAVKGGGYFPVLINQVTLPNQHPGDLCLLQNGHLLLVHGNRIKPYGVGAALSHDGGETWDSDKRLLVAWTSLNTDCGYPSVVQLDDGTIVMIYYSVGTEDISKEEMAIVVRYNKSQ